MPGRCNGGEARKILQYFSESDDKENEIRKHIREKLIIETELFFTSCLHETTAGEILLNQYVALYSVKPLGTKVIIFPLIFIQKPRPCVLHTNQKI